MGDRLYYTIGGLTLDDTVLDSGEVRWSAPGGNALYSAVGARMWRVDVGIVALIGEDYPTAHLDRLVAAGFDLSGIRRTSQPSFHVWVLHEGDGRRQIVYRLNSGKNEYLDPGPSDLPPETFLARGVHLCPIPGRSQAALMEHLLPQQVPLFLDLISIPGQIDPTVGQNTKLWPQLRAFLPSLEEIQLLVNPQPERDLVTNMGEWMPEIFAIKMGVDGSLVRHPAATLVYHVPAFHGGKPVDTTGAGDAFCGGFMAGLQETGDPVEAALWGTVSASFVIEECGALHALDVSAAMAQARLDALRDKVKPVYEGLGAFLRRQRTK